MIRGQWPVYQKVPRNPSIRWLSKLSLGEVEHALPEDHNYAELVEQVPEVVFATKIIRRKFLTRLQI